MNTTIDIDPAKFVDPASDSMQMGPDSAEMEWANTPLSDAENRLSDIENAERYCRSAEASVEIAKENLKEAKADYDRQVDRLRSLARASANDADRPLLPENQAQEDQPDRWRIMPIEVLWETEFKGLGKAKIEALIDEVGTLGAFEDLRKQVGQDFEHLSAALPGGIGAKLADELEERHINYITEHAQKEVKPEDQEQSGFEKQLLERVGELLADDPDWTEGEGEIWDEGAADWGNGLDVDQCPYRDSQDDQDAWLMGFYNAQRLSELESGEEGSTEETDEYEDL